MNKLYVNQATSHGCRQSTPSLVMLVILFTFFVSGCAAASTTAGEQENEQTEVESTDEKDSEIRMESEVPPGLKREFRASWIATVSNLDWPSEPGLPVEEQKAELIKMLDRASAMNMNAIIFQVRPAADALYDSPYEPWSTYLTGEMGQEPVPYYDPLEFAVEEAHKRGLELHAWFNPYRARHPSDTTEFSPDHISIANPDYVVEYGDYLWMDPGMPEVAEHSLNVMLDVVERYDVDGIHLDDYFYPYAAYDDGADFPDSLSWQQAQEDGVDMDRDDWRRQNVDEFIRSMYEKVKDSDPHVKVGISPIGFWRPGYPEGTAFGFDAYEELYADSRKWLQEGWVDYFTPQLYYEIDTPGWSFPEMLAWWVDQNDKDRHMWPGLFTTRVEPPSEWRQEEITGQILLTRGHPGATGTVHFRHETLTENYDRLGDYISAYSYHEPALVPPSPWMNDEAPDQPEVDWRQYPDRMHLHMSHEQREDVRWWVLRTKTHDDWEVDVIPGDQHRVTYSGSEATVWPDSVALSAVDRYGNESAPLVKQRPDTRSFDTGEVLSEDSPDYESVDEQTLADLKPEIVERTEWGEQPGGRHANGVRRNLQEQDTLLFRDLAIVTHELLEGEEPDDENNDNADEEENENSATPDSIRVTLARYGTSEDRVIPEEEAFNWYGYHIGAVAVNADTTALAGGLTEFEVATTQPLIAPPGGPRASEMETGGAGDRLRIPHTVHTLALHHTAGDELTEEDDPVEALNDLYNWGAEERNWWDVPYHYLIDLDGNIYEGRDRDYAGDTNTSYDPAGAIHVAFIGNYSEQEPDQSQIEAVADLKAWVSAKYGIDTDRVVGHYNLTDTSCPGDNLQPVLEDRALHEMINDRLEEAGLLR